MEDSDEEMDAFGRDFYGDFDNDEESIGPGGAEVEQKEHSLGDQKLTCKIFLAEDEGHEDEFTRGCRPYVFTAATKEKRLDGVSAGTSGETGFGTVSGDMEEPCQELSLIAFEMFNRYGRLRKELKDAPIQKGTGVWGSELDLGSFFVIEDLLIDKEWTRWWPCTKPLSMRCVRGW